MSQEFKNSKKKKWQQLQDALNTLSYLKGSNSSTMFLLQLLCKRWQSVYLACGMLGFWRTVLGLNPRYWRRTGTNCLDHLSDICPSDPRWSWNMGKIKMCFLKPHALNGSQPGGLTPSRSRWQSRRNVGPKETGIPTRGSIWFMSRGYGPWRLRDVWSKKL